jgi:predicted RNA-binding Zn ribbon-like protein
MQMSRVQSEENGLEVCLEFANTVDWRTSSHAEDKLHTYADLVRWSQGKDIINQDEARSLLEQTGNQGAAGEYTLKQAHALRESIYAIFSAVAHVRQASPVDVAALNGYLARAMSKMEVQITKEGYRLGWCPEKAADSMLYPLAKSAAELVTSSELSRVKECANEEEGCGSLFLDNSKSHSRRWCTMDSCGNKIKVRTYYARHGRLPKMH